MTGFENKPFNALLVAEIVASPNPFRSGVGVWNRLDIARAAGREKTTHVISTIELAVRLGYIHVYDSHDGVRACKCYTAQPPMF